LCKILKKIKEYNNFSIKHFKILQGGCVQGGQGPSKIVSHFGENGKNKNIKK
jgi:hypothetical protein